MNNAQTKPLRVAVASSDGVLVDRHFGRAESFRVYEIANGQAVFLEERHTGSLCGEIGHDDTQVASVARQLGDCRFVVSVQVGQPIARLLEPAGFTFVNTEGDVADMLARIARSPIAKHFGKQARQPGIPQEQGHIHAQES